MHPILAFAVLMLATLLGACAEPTGDRWPPAAFAVLTGTVRHPSGARYVRGGLTLTCGPTRPSDVVFNTVTDDTGGYRLELNLPAVPVASPDSFAELCEGRDPSPASAFRIDTVEVPFTRLRAMRVTTRFDFGP